MSGQGGDRLQGRQNRLREGSAASNYTRYRSRRDRSFVLTILKCQLNRFKRLSDSTYLVKSDQHRICHSFGDALSEYLFACAEEIIADNLYLVSQDFSQVFPTRPVVFCQSVLEQYDRVRFHPLFPKFDHIIT